MIERLINLERPYGEPEYSKRTEEISRLKDSLCGQLDQKGVQWLKRLTNAYMRQENAVLCDVFSDDFWTAVKLMLEFEWRMFFSPPMIC